MRFNEGFKIGEIFYHILKMRLDFNEDEPLSEEDEFD
jgi:hypothetical protein